MAGTTPTVVHTEGAGCSADGAGTGGSRSGDIHHICIMGREPSMASDITHLPKDVYIKEKPVNSVMSTGKTSTSTELNDVAQ